MNETWNLVKGVPGYGAVYRWFCRMEDRRARKTNGARAHGQRTRTGKRTKDDGDDNPPDAGIRG